MVKGFNLEILDGKNVQVGWGTHQMMTFDLKNVNAGWKEIPDVDAAREDLGVAV